MTRDRVPEGATRPTRRELHVLPGGTLSGPSGGQAEAPSHSVDELPPLTARPDRGFKAEHPRPRV